MSRRELVKGRVYLTGFPAKALVRQSSRTSQNELEAEQMAARMSTLPCTASSQKTADQARVSQHTPKGADGHRRCSHTTLRYMAYMALATPSYAGVRTIPSKRQHVVQPQLCKPCWRLTCARQSAPRALASKIEAYAIASMNGVVYVVL